MFGSYDEEILEFKNLIPRQIKHLRMHVWLVYDYRYKNYNKNHSESVYKKYEGLLTETPNKNKKFTSKNMLCFVASIPLENLLTDSVIKGGPDQTWLLFRD